MHKLSTAATGLAALALIATGSPAAFAGSGTGLDGTDPITTNCSRTQVVVGNKTYLIRQGTYHWAEARVMYSRQCGTAWVDYYLLKEWADVEGNASRPDTGAHFRYGWFLAYDNVWENTQQMYSPGNSPVHFDLHLNGDSGANGYFTANCADTCTVTTHYYPA